MKVNFPSRDASYSYTMKELKNIAPTMLTTPLPWERKLIKYNGVYLYDLLNNQEIISKINYIEVSAANGYKAKITGDSLEKEAFFLAYQANGRDISIRKKGPILIISDLSKLSEEEMSELSLSYHLVWFATEITVYE